jgi:hypothetical protein
MILSRSSNPFSILKQLFNTLQYIRSEMSQSFVSTLIEKTSSKLVKHCVIPMLKSQPFYKNEMDSFLERVVSKCEMEFKELEEDEEEYDEYELKRELWDELADMLHGGLFSSDNINLNMDLQEELMERQEEAQDTLYHFIDTLRKEYKNM